MPEDSIIARRRPTTNDDSFLFIVHGASGTAASGGVQIGAAPPLGT